MIMSWVDDLINSPLFIPATAIALIIIIIVMLYGNRKNRQRMKEIWAVLVEAIKTYGDKVGHSGGYRRLTRITQLP
jgi:preprotein translocase subunit YajC